MQQCQWWMCGDAVARSRWVCGDAVARSNPCFLC